MQGGTFRANRCQYEMNAEVIDTVDEEKDLGLLISGTLKAASQCAADVERANNVLRMIWLVVVSLIHALRNYLVKLRDCFNGCFQFVK